MIDPRELRLGNLVYYDNLWSLSQDDPAKYNDFESFYIEGLSKSNVSLFLDQYLVECPYESIYPIKLTEQHLIDFGAKNKFGNTYYLHKMKFDFNTQGTCRFYWSGKVTYVDYLHHLQNIVKDLTGKELTK